MNTMNGGCFCGNIEVDITLPNQPENYNPRACNCDFCVKHGAAYVSDPNGSLAIRVRNAAQLNTYRQGSGTAECLMCSNCGVLVAITYAEEGRRFGTVNVRSIIGAENFGEHLVVSPKKLSPSEKTERWNKLWFRDTTFVSQ